MTFRSINAAFDALRSAAFGSVGASYAALGDPLSRPAVALILSSSLDKDVLISTDGSTDMIYLGAAATITIGFGANGEAGDRFYLPKGTQLYQKRGPAGASGSGSIGVTVIYEALR